MSAWLDDYEHHVNPGLARLFRFMGLERGEVSAHGVWVTVEGGERYLDASSGYGVMVHGYTHPRLVAVAHAQIDRMALSSRVLPSTQTAELGCLLAEVTPGDLSLTFFSNSGAEAVEAALKFARRSTGRRRIVAAQGAFHGKTFGALSVSGREVFRAPFRPLLPEITHVPYGDAAALAAAVDRQTAAVILEPIQGEGGIVVPPDGYLRAARTACDEAGALLILDEVQTGLGRTGRLFATEHEGVAPDLMCLAKALGGGIVPVGATVGNERAMGFLAQDPLLHTSTFGGSPLACAVGAEAVRIAVEEDFPGQARRKGERLRRGLEKVLAPFTGLVEQVRGRALMLGLVTPSAGVAGALMSQLLDERVLAVYTHNSPRVIRMMPPIVITDDELDELVERIGRAAADVAPLLAELVTEGA